MNTVVGASDTDRLVDALGRDAVNATPERWNADEECLSEARQVVVGESTRDEVVDVTATPIA